MVLYWGAAVKGAKLSLAHLKPCDSGIYNIAFGESNFHIDASRGVRVHCWLKHLAERLVEVYPELPQPTL